MRTIGIFIALLFCTATAGFSQIDTSRIEVKPRQTTEVTNQDNVYSKELPKDIGEPKDSAVVDMSLVPARIRRRLDREPQYIGWQSGQMYRSKNTGLYMLYLTDSVRVRVYEFNKWGKPVTINTFDRKKE